MEKKLSTSSPIKQVAGRFKTEWLNSPSLANFYDEFDKLDRAVTALNEHRAKLVAEGNLTPAGIDQALREFAKAKVIPVIKSADDRIKSAATAVQQKRDGLARPKIDKNDAAAAALRAEIRAHLRSMNPAQRTGFVLKNSTTEVISAVIEAPSFLSGVDADLQKQAESIWVERTSPNDVAFADTAMEALGTLDAAIKISLNAVQKNVDYEGKSGAFDKWMSGEASPSQQKKAAA